VSDYEVGSVYDQVVIDGRDASGPSVGVNFIMKSCQIGAILARHGGGASIVLDLHQCHVGAFIFADEGIDNGASVGVSGDNTHFDVFVINSSDSVVELSGDDVTFGHFVTSNVDPGSVDNLSTTRRQYDVGREVANFEEDKNSGIASDGFFEWDLATDTISSTAITRIFRGYEATALTVATFSLVLEDLGAVRVLLGRSTFQFDQDLTATVV